jgi:cellulose synthase/poly-beta-1,6-N-acetylglucosamine synthase-like glycosyltransferase
VQSTSTFPNDVKGKLNTRTLQLTFKIANRYHWPMRFFAVIYAGLWFSVAIFFVFLLLRHRKHAKMTTHNLNVDASLPAVSVLMPIKGPVAHFREVLWPLLTQDYPGSLEIILAFQDADDPSIAEAQSLVAEWQGQKNTRVDTHVDTHVDTTQEHNERRIIWLTGLAPLGLNPKNSNLAHALDCANHPWIFVCDSDTQIPLRFLRQAMALTQDNENHFVTAATVHFGARTLGALLETINLNVALVGYFLLGHQLKRHPIPVNGASLLFHRRLLQRCGGVDITLNTLTEDAILAEAFAKQGARGFLAPQFVWVKQDRQTLRGFFQRALRWMLIARIYHPQSILTPCFWVAQWLLVLGWLLSDTFILQLSATVATGHVVLTIVYHVLLNAPKTDWFKAPIVLVNDLIGPLLWIASLTKSHVHWNGSDLFVQSGGRLALKDSG